jgi:small-conductance mechanosensitive channel
MDWAQLFSAENLKVLAWPLGAGAAVMVIALFLRRFLYSYIRKLTAKTKTCFDDIIVRDTRLVTILWCVWWGLYTGFTIAEPPPEWDLLAGLIVPVIFVALAIYTATVVLMAVLQWYKAEICPRSNSAFDDVVMSFLIVATPVAGTVLGAIQVLKMLGYESDPVNAFFAEHGARLAALTILTVLLILGTVFVIPKVIRTAVRNSRAEQSEEEANKRADTLISVIGTTLQILFIVIYILMVLSEFNLNITAILAGASVVGVALGFGAQSLVKDVLAGLFVIMENQYRKGDVVKIADTSGVVEEINLRRTILRDMDGVTHTVPNGEIRVASNFTKLWSRVNLNISVSYDTDLDEAIKVINKVGKDLADDPTWLPFIITPPKAIRIDKLGESGIDIKIVGETKPSRQWDVTGELRLRLKKAFDKEGIEIPWPHTKIYFGNCPPPGLTGSMQTNTIQTNSCPVEEKKTDKK